MGTQMDESIAQNGQQARKEQLSEKMPGLHPFATFPQVISLFLNS